MRRDIDYHIELFTQRVGFVDAELQIFVIEFVITHAQRVARLARVNGICAISESVTHIFQRSRRGKEFRFKHDFLVLMTGQIRRTRCGELGSAPTLRAGIVAPWGRGVNISRVSLAISGRQIFTGHESRGRSLLVSAAAFPRRRRLTRLSGLPGPRTAVNL